MYDRGIGVLLILRGPGRLRRRPGARRAREPPRPLPHDLRRRRHRAAAVARGRVAAPARPRRGRRRSATRSSPRSPTTPPTNRSAPIRTARYKYMRRFDDEHPGRVLANVDDGLTKDVLLAAGLGRRRPAGRGALRPVARSRPRAPTGSTTRRSPTCSPTCAAGSTTGWCGPTTRCSTVRSPPAAGHRVQHRRPAVAERSDHAADHAQPHPHPTARDGREID